MNSGQGLPITSVVLVIIAVVVVTVFIIYILTTSGKGFDITQNYWSGSGNLTKNASIQAGSAPPEGGLNICSDFGGPCSSIDNCCNKHYLCYSKSFSNYQSNKKTCNDCVYAGGFCSSDQDCCNNNCLDHAPPTANSKCV